METSNISKKTLWVGRILSGLPILFLLFDSIGKFIKPTAVIEGTTALGYSPDVLTGLGVVLLFSTLLYALPRTALLGAILLTGYLGGAVATHVRVGNPWPSHILFPVYLGIMIWGGLFLRNPKVRSLLIGNVS